MESFPDGIKVLYDCPNAVADICFVHGLNGDRESTWTASSCSEPWPSTLLALEITNVRILTYGYDAYVVRRGVAGSNRLIDHATNLLHDLTTDRAKAGASSRSLIFVAHSLGGLVCKQTILLSRDSPDSYLRAIFDSTVGIAFMGTPHRGSWMSYWGKVSAAALGLAKSTNASLVQVLKQDDQLLESIQLQFWTMVRGWDKTRQLGIACFFEELPIRGVGKVVPKESATLEGYTSLSIHANHSDMVKFATTEDAGFRRVCGNLTRWVAQGVASSCDVVLQPEGCLKSLAFLEMEDRSQGVHNAGEGTCEWLLRHQAYTTWIASERALLWITGKPGSGKSTALKYTLCHHQKEINAVILSFFFHGRGNELQRSSFGFYRTILHQVLAQAPSAAPELINTFETKKRVMGEAGEKWQWHQSELSASCISALSKLLKSCSVWLFVDALDECTRTEASTLVHELKRLIQQPPTRFQLHICLSCRHYPIQDEICEPQICLERSNGHDISTYVRHALSTKPPLMASGIPSLISERAHGVFLWARLVIEQVLDLHNAREPVEEIEKVINRIPPDLDDLYCGIVKSMKGKVASLRLIQCVCVATRPLLLGEMNWAINFEDCFPYKSLQQYRKSTTGCEENAFGKRVISLSHGLAEIVQPANSVQFIHESVKEFFASRGLPSLSDKTITGDMAIEMGHFRLFRICTRYLIMEASLTGPTNIACCTFVRYALYSWMTHLKNCQTTTFFSRGDILGTATLSSNAFVEHWGGIFRLVDPNSAICPRKGSNIMHIMARYGICGIVRLILQNLDQFSEDIDSQDESGCTPLSYAATEGHAPIVKLLLESDRVNADSRDVAGRSPLLHCARRGHEDVMRLLLDSSKVSADATDQNGGTPLSWAAAEGHTAIVKLLLESGKVNATSIDIFGRTPLSYAAGRGHDDICGLLLDYGIAGADEADHWCRTPLLFAAEQNHMAVAKLALIGKNDDLKEYGDLPAGWEERLTPEGRVYYADHNSKATTWVHPGDSAQRLTTLQKNPSTGHAAVIKLLLDRDEVNADTEDCFGRTPLSYAAQAGNVAGVRLLLQKSTVAVNSKSKPFSMQKEKQPSYASRNNIWIELAMASLGVLPLQRFVSYLWRTQFSPAVRELTSPSNSGQWPEESHLPVDRNNFGPKNTVAGRTPLSYAAENGHADVVRLLLGSDKADVDSSDENGQTPLSYAINNGHCPVVDLLSNLSKTHVRVQDEDGPSSYTVELEQS